MTSKKKPDDDGTAMSEALAEVSETVPVIKFRGVEFKIPAEVWRSIHVQMAFAADSTRDIIYKVLHVADPTYPALFLAQCAPGDDMGSVADEFIAALNEAATGGNG